MIGLGLPSLLFTSIVPAIRPQAAGSPNYEPAAAEKAKIARRGVVAPLTIYLQGNPLLESPLKLADIKPRLLGHWGTTPGLNFLYVHLNRLIKENDLNMIYVIGPGHGGPGLVAQTYLEGSYTERYPAIERSRNGLHRLFRQFSWPYGIPSHVSPETPGSE